MAKACKGCEFYLQIGANAHNKFLEFNSGRCYFDVEPGFLASLFAPRYPLNHPCHRPGQYAKKERE